MKVLVGAALVVAMVACSSSDEGSSPGGGCTDIAGNYNVKVTPLSGDCPPGDGKDVQVTVVRSGTSYGLANAVTTGTCAAELNSATCKLTSTCRVTADDGSTVANINYDYTFSGSTFTGTVTGALFPPEANPACTATARHEGGRIQ